MNLHEYQAKALLRRYGLPILQGYVAYTEKEAQKAFVNLGGPKAVVKAQVHAGGRGKAGGVKLVSSAEEARSSASDIIGMKLVSPQTGAEGVLVQKVLVEQGADISREFYLSFLVDRKAGSIAVVASAEGGMEIEEVAKNEPEKIIRVLIPPEIGMQPFHSRIIARFLGLDVVQQRALSQVLEGLYLAFVGLDCSLLEINPLVLTGSDELICLDVKMSVDDNSLFRQRQVFEFADYDQIDEREVEATEVGLSYIALGGNIGCMVNGAGLAMATADIIKQSGGEPANFLDVGGSATAEMVSEALKIILMDTSVEAVLVNIFGGIMRCDVIAEGIVEAAKGLNIEVPLIVRLSGTNVDIGKKMLADSGLAIISADDLGDAASKAVAAIA